MLKTYIKIYMNVKNQYIINTAGHLTGIIQFNNAITH